MKKDINEGIFNTAKEIAQTFLYDAVQFFE